MCETCAGRVVWLNATGGRVEETKKLAAFVAKQLHNSKAAGVTKGLAFHHTARHYLHHITLPPSGNGK